MCTAPLARAVRVVLDSSSAAPATDQWLISLSPSGPSQPKPRKIPGKPRECGLVIHAYASKLKERRVIEVGSTAENDARFVAGVCGEHSYGCVLLAPRIGDDVDRCVEHVLEMQPRR